VSGEQSGNIVVISPDGNAAKEVYQISSPRAMCYDESVNEILVCNTGKRVFWFEIENSTTAHGLCVRRVKQFIAVTGDV
jgi:hypothetical protein